MKNIFILLAYFTGSILMAQTIDTDRPDQTESSSTIPAGTLQIESGFLVQYNSDEGTAVQSTLLPTTLFRYALNSWFELRFVSQVERSRYLNFEPNWGMSDLEVGAKIQLFKKEGVNTEIAFMTHLITPTGSPGLSNYNYGTINRFLISHNITESTSIGYNLGYNYFDQNNHHFIYTVALNHKVSDRSSVYIEPYGNFTHDGEWESSFDAGVAYLLKPNVQLDLSFATGINYIMNYFSCGISWNSGR